MSTKIENVETLVNEFWMFEGEPFHLVRYKCDGVPYLCGFSGGLLILDSLGIAASRGGLYMCPKKEHIEQLQEHFNAGLQTIPSLKDGTYGPLFINRKLRLVVGESYPEEDLRPGFGMCVPIQAPHLNLTSERVWCKVEFEHKETIVRPECQGGIWYLGKTLRIIEEL